MLTGVWLEWEFFPDMGTEARLSRLCYWILKLDATDNEYGLRLPGIEIAPNRGPEHREELLKSLALFGVDSADAGQDS